MLSTGVWSLSSTGQATQKEKDGVAERGRVETANWDVQEFQREQLRGLIRQVFLPGVNPPVRQVIFSAIEPETDVCVLSKEVAELLAAQTAADVAFVDGSHSAEDSGMGCSLGLEDLKQSGERVSTNFFVPQIRSLGGNQSGTTPLRLYFEELRRQFEYSIVAAPPALRSTETFTMAHYADGIVLVLSAQRTRRGAAIKVRNGLGQVRLLGTVLSEREFPIPWEIYRRL
jgi:receptor protein-tyrosine kinase